MAFFMLPCPAPSASGSGPRGLAIPPVLYGKLVEGLSRWLRTGDERGLGTLHDLGLRMKREQGGLVRIEGRSEMGRRHGLYVVRPSGAPLVLVAPHAVSDRRTGSLARRMFERGGARALLLGTVHRDGPEAHRGRRRPGFDLAHLDLTVMQALVEALARQPAPPLVVELHGFDGKDDPQAGQSPVDLIASTGGEDPTPALRLLLHLGLQRAAVHGVDVFELGGTTNAQGRLVSSLAPGRFLHLEMSPGLRRRLMRRERLLCSLVDALFKTETEKETPAGP